MSTGPNTYLIEMIAEILEEERYHCVDCIDYHKDGNANTTTEEWVERTAKLIAEKVEREFMML